MSTLYWAKEYILVFLAYGFVMFIWPELVFRRFLRGKSLTMRVCFDTMVMPCIINLLVIFLGICHMLNPWVVRILFWGGLLASLLIPFIRENGTHTLQRFAALLTGGYGIKSFGRNVIKAIGNMAKSAKRKINGRLLKHTVLYALLIAGIVYGMIYFGASTFEVPSYGVGDMYRHHNWIYEMTKGVMYAEGIYPSGMHSFVYMINTCFGISVYSVMLFLQPVHVGLFLLTVFLFAKEIFNWRYTGIMVLLLFVTMGFSVINSLNAFSRLQWTLPQEFAAPAALICPLFLLKYVKNVRNNGKTGKIEKIYRDENLLIFGLALSLTISTHFYCTIIAFFLCLPIALPFFKEVISKRHFGRILLTVIVATLLAAVPMVASIPGVSARMAAAEKQKEEESKKETSDTVESGNTAESGSVADAGNSEGAAGSEEKTDNETGKDKNKSPFQGSIDWAIGVISGEKNTGSSTATPTLVPEMPGESGTLTWIGWISIILHNFLTINYGEVFDEIDINFYQTATVVSIVCLVVVAVSIAIITRVFKKKGKQIPEFTKLSSIVALLLMLFNLLLMCEPGVFGLPRLIAQGRLPYYVTALSMMVVFIPVDLIVGNLNTWIKGKFDWIFALVGSVVTVVMVIYSANFHGGLYLELTRYNSVVNTTIDIMENNEDFTYTIISTTTEIWQVSSKGYHEEIAKLVDRMISDSYILSTERVYLFIEKHPLSYAQKYFPELPAWLANNDRSGELYKSDEKVSVGEKNIIYFAISEEYGDSLHIKVDESMKDVYTNEAKRTIIESRAMNWVKDFERLYPRTLKVYYEDEDFVCYYFEQDPSSPYELALQKQTD